jgi:hypothetical protein
MSNEEPMGQDAEMAVVIPETGKPPKVERITAADIPRLGAAERRKWAERAIKEGKVFDYVSGHWP